MGGGGEEGVQPAGGQRWVCSGMGAGEGANTGSVSLYFAPSPAHKPDQHLNNRTIIAAAADTAGLKGDPAARLEVRPLIAKHCANPAATFK